VTPLPLRVRGALFTDSTPFLILSVVTELSMNPHRRLSFGITKIDKVFPGFQRGDFAVLYGHPLCEKLCFLLGVRCQLSLKRGGLNSRVVYIDGGNTFDPYAVSAMAQEYGAEPRSVLEGIVISRAFTAYQLTALMSERLEEALKQYRARLVIVSDIIGLFLDRDVPEQEGKEVLAKTTQRLSDIASKRHTIVIASHFPRPHANKSRFLESVLFGNANIVIGVKEAKGVLKLSIESHPTLLPFTIDLPSNTVTLETFMEV